MILYLLRIALGLLGIAYCRVTPVILAHGMGDSCFNPGMISIGTAVAKWLAIPKKMVLCIPLDEGHVQDSLYSFSLTMNSQVEIFSEGIRIVGERFGIKEFNGMGFSQGNLLLRAYAQRYNTRPGYPRLSTFISVHGPMLGVAALPHCNPDENILPLRYFCKLLLSVSSNLAYTSFIQQNLAQSNYLRSIGYFDGYMTTDFLPFLNKERHDNEVGSLDTLDMLVLVKAQEDSMVNPKESEWFEYYAEDAPILDKSTIVKFNETDFYKLNMFGLKTLHQAGKIAFIESPGDHLQIPSTQLQSLVKKYFKTSVSSPRFQTIDE